MSRKTRPGRPNKRPADAPERAADVLEAYKKAFDGFSDEEMNLLDGIVMEPESADPSPN